MTKYAKKSATSPSGRSAKDDARGDSPPAVGRIPDHVRVLVPRRIRIVEPSGPESGPVSICCQDEEADTHEYAGSRLWNRCKMKRYTA